MIGRRSLSAAFALMGILVTETAARAEDSCPKVTVGEVQARMSRDWAQIKLQQEIARHQCLTRQKIELPQFQPVAPASHCITTYQFGAAMTQCY